MTGLADLKLITILKFVAGIVFATGAARFLYCNFSNGCVVARSSATGSHNLLPRYSFRNTNSDRKTIMGATYGPDVLLETHQMLVTKKEDLANFLAPFDEHRKLFFVLLSHEAPDFKQVCAVESASRANPDFIILLINIVDEQVRSGFYMRKNAARVSAPLFAQLQVFQRPNVLVVHVDLHTLLAGTQFETLFAYRTPDEGYFAPGMADGIRLQLVHDFGGAYTDLDMMHKESLNGFRNVLAREDAEDSKEPKLCNAHVIFDKGHPFLKRLIDKFFEVGEKSAQWGSTGPFLFTEIWNECRKNKGKECEGVHEEPYQVFNPVLSSQGSSWLESWQKHPTANKFYKAIYEPKEGEPKAITMHMWNTLITYWVGKNPNPINGTYSLLGYAMSKHCPLVFEHTQNTKNHDPTW